MRKRWFRKINQNPGRWNEPIRGAMFCPSPELEPFDVDDTDIEEWTAQCQPAPQPTRGGEVTDG